MGWRDFPLTPMEVIPIAFQGFQNIADFTGEFFGMWGMKLPKEQSTFGQILLP